MSAAIRRSAALALFAVSLAAGAVPVSAEDTDEVVAPVVIASPLQAATPVAHATAVPAVDAGQDGRLPMPRQSDRRQVASPAVRLGLYVSFATLQALDAHSTLRALQAGGREANPFMQGLASNNATLVAVKAGTAAATIYLAERLARKRPVTSLIMMAALNSAYATVVSHNYGIARRH